MADLFTTQDITIYSEDGTKAVSVITDGVIQRLAVDARVTIADKYKPRYAIATAPVAVGAGATTTLVNVNGIGKIDFYKLIFESDKFEIIMIVDGVTVLTVLTKALADNLDFTTFPNADIFLKDAKQIHEKFTVPVDFVTNFQLRVRNPDTSARDVKASYVRYRII